jgi:putative ATP-binding cassette transporter
MKTQDSPENWREIGSQVTISICGTALSGSINGALGQKIIAALRKNISERIIRAPISLLEAYRPHRLVSILTNDIDTISAFTFALSNGIIIVAIVLGCFAYLFILSPLLFLFSFVTFILGVLVNLFAQRS